MTVVLAAAILGVTTLWVLSPILGWSGREEETSTAAAAEREELLHSRRQALASIKDLEMEYRVGKLTEEDYNRTRQGLETEAMNILRKLDSPGGGETGPSAAAPAMPRPQSRPQPPDDE